jgi:hypothetical protein
MGAYVECGEAGSGLAGNNGTTWYHLRGADCCDQ